MGNTTMKILEVDLFKSISDFLIEQGYTVRSEVKDCDIAAYKNEELVIVELKRNLSVDLLAQSVKRQKSADIVYMAVPKPKRLTGNAKWKDIIHLVRRLELGLILVSFKGEKGFVEIAVHPTPYDREASRRNNKKKRESIIKEAKGRYLDANVGGSTRTKLVTAYKENAIFVACCLDKYGPMSPKQIKELGTDKKQTDSALKGNFYDWFDKVEKGIYTINDAGRAALKEHKQFAEYYYSKLEEK
ncbi:MAG TPA: DUF2161 family putative PD-(D/E)XK-type phosphodiesterase [Patescibacteria group bacterium]|nr:DUF2161 family putative PD-(D/E)XK-type phosphodiesterase [Patescibacteria group bacterium]